MTKRKRCRASGIGCVELLENRQFLSCAVASPISHASFSPPLGLQTMVFTQQTSVNGVAVPAGTYSLQQFENIILGAPAANPVNVAISADGSQVTPSQPSPTLSVAVTDPDGNLVSDGTVTFYTARPAYDVSNSQRFACQDDAAATKVALGSVTLTGGEAQFPLSALPAGEDWVWAEYTSDSVTVPVVSTYLPFTSTVATGVHVEHAGTYTATNAPQMAFTLTDGQSAPLLGQSFAAPAGVEGSILSGQAKFAFRATQPGLPAFGSASYRGVLTNKTSVYGPTLVRPAKSGTYVATGTIKGGAIGGVGTIIHYATGNWTGANGYAAGYVNFSGGFGYTGYSGSAHTISGSGYIYNLTNPSSLTFNGGSVTLSWINTQTWTHTQDAAPMPTGSLTVSEGGRTLVSTSIDSLGTALAHPEGLGVGHHQLTVSYAGDSYFAASSDSVEFDITPTPVSVKLGLSAATAVSGGSYAATINVSTLSQSLGSLKGTIELLCDNKLFKSMQITEGTKTLTASLPGGKHNISARFAGSDGFGTALSAPQQIKILVNQRPQGAFWVSRQGVIRGVVIDPNQPGAAVTCDILIDGKPWQRVVANQATGAAAAAGNRSLAGANGRHDLNVALSELPSGKHLIQLVAYDADSGVAFQVGDNYWVKIKVV